MLPWALMLPYTAVRLICEDSCKCCYCTLNALASSGDAASDAVILWVFFYVRSFAVRALASGNAGEC